MRQFISYSHHDKALAAGLVRQLIALGHDPWFDIDLVSDAPWPDQLDEHIDRCDQFVYTLTPDSVASAWCSWEFASAVQHGKPIVAVLLTTGAPLPAGLGSCTPVDCSGDYNDEVLTVLQQAVDAAPVIPPEQAPVVPDVPDGLPASAPRPRDPEA